MSVSLCVSQGSNTNDGGTLKQLHVGHNNHLPDEWDGRTKFLAPTHLASHYTHPHLEMVIMALYDRLDKRASKDWTQVPTASQVGMDDPGLMNAWLHVRDVGIKGPKNKKRKTKALTLKCQEVYRVSSEEWNIRADVFHHGPVTVSFPVNDGFAQYINALLSGETVDPVWKDSDIESDQWLTARIVGWGVSESNVPYWIVAGNWGVQLGMGVHAYGRNGYFLVERGNGGPFEQHVFGGLLTSRDCCKSQESHPIQVFVLGDGVADVDGGVSDVMTPNPTATQNIPPKANQTPIAPATTQPKDSPVIDLDNPFILLLCGCVIMIIVLLILMGLSFRTKHSKRKTKVPSTINVPPTKKTVRFAPHIKQE
ncbi:MAG: hypothetical protein K0U52_03700 [Gammaproteobacteria bacterium]|nr:hypothetical protein [Gammaproteobacteria bacterium]